MMFEEVLQRRDFFGKKGSVSLAWLMFVSLMRDDLPWLYELGMEVYRALRSGHAHALDDARCEFQRMARPMRNGHPMLMDMLDTEGDEDSFMALRHLPRIADEFLHRLRLLRPAAETTSNGKTAEPRAETTIDLGGVTGRRPGCWRAVFGACLLIDSELGKFGC
jgi:hypothetical protein